MDELEIARARRAKRLLAEPDIAQAFADVEASALQDIRHTAHDEAAKRERIHAELRALDRVRAQLQAWADVLIHEHLD